ncbi:MAG: pyrimidine dimer DNA glycosylase/endonuclease V [Pseudomonadota bacterium]
MRLWSLHPKYLDAQGLVALWREALLARAVLRGKTRGYKHHPQLDRFRSHRHPLSAINAYLYSIHVEASARGYAFDAGKIGPRRPVALIPVATGQIRHEWKHLRHKLSKRAPYASKRWSTTKSPGTHSLFRRVDGPIASWERTNQ